MTVVLLVDLSSIAHPIWHTSASDSNPNATSIKTVERVRALASGQPHVAICCDSGRSFRRDVSADYKANRPPSDATLQHQMVLAVDILKADGFPVWAVAGFEADDLIAAAVHRALKGLDDVSILIASADKDLLQLAGDRVKVHRLNGEVWDAAMVQTKLGVAPHQVVDYLSLVGDASDNIKGASGIGAVKATAMLAKYGNLDDLYAALDSGETFQPSTVKALTEFRPRMAEVRALVTLRTDVPLPFEEVLRTRVPADVATFGEEEPMETIDVQPQVPLPEPEPPMDAHAAKRVLEDAHAKAEGQYRAMPTTEAVAVRQPDVVSDVRWQLEPRSMPDAITLAKHMHESRLFGAYGTPQAVLSTILAGRELGMQAMASLRAFHIIDSKPCMSSDLIRALVMQSPQCEYFRCTARSPESATFVTKRKGDEPVSLTFTLEEAKAAGLVRSGSGWAKNPADMCVARASSKLARLVYADVVFNMYAPEEME